MKKIILMIIVLIIIPFFVVNFYNYDMEYDEKTINLKYISSIFVRVKRVNKDRIDNVMLEDYVVGVVAGEMPVSFDMEALKAQAVASRSYVLRKLNDNRDGSYDVVDTTSNQVYFDLDDLKNNWQDNYINYLNKVREAVNATAGEYLEYNGDVANTMFFSTSNGYTEDCSVVFSSDVPYLRSVESNWDSSVNSNFNYVKEVSLKEFYNMLGLTFNNKLNIIILKRSNSNRVISLKINGVNFSGSDVYNRLKIRSTDFNITQNGDKIIIKTKGFGHGVGMSQYGAYGMAKAGYNYKEILSHYYVGTNLNKVNL